MRKCMQEKKSKCRKKGKKWTECRKKKRKKTGKKSSFSGGRTIHVTKFSLFGGVREQSGLSPTATGSRGVGYLPRTGAGPLPPGRPSSSPPHPGGGGGPHPPPPPTRGGHPPHPTGEVTLLLTHEGGDPPPPPTQGAGGREKRRTGIRARTRYGNPDRKRWLPEQSTSARASAESKSTCVACALYIYM